MADRFDDVTRPGFTLRTDHRCAFGNTPQGFTEAGRAAHEWYIECHLVNVVGLVGGG